MKRIGIIVVTLCSMGAVASADETYVAGGTMITAGGGVLDFVGDDMQTATGSGGTWEARIAVATRRVVSFELTYIGSAQTLEDAGRDLDAWLIGTGAEGGVRFTLGRGALRTIFTVGGGWRRYEVSGDVTTLGMMPSDDVVTVPAGVGLLVREAGFVFELRAVGRTILFADLLPSSADRMLLDHWATTAHIGIEL